MFAGNKKLCSLSHLRLKESNVTYSAMNASSCSPLDIQECNETFNESQNNFFATPEQLEDTLSRFTIFTHIQDENESQFDHTRTIIVSQDPNTYLVYSKTSKPGKKSSQVSQNYPTYQIGFICGRFHSNCGTLHCMTCCIRSNSISSVTIIKEMFHRLIKTVVGQVVRVSVGVYKENLRLIGYLEKIGFVHSSITECFQNEIIDGVQGYFIDASFL